MAREEGPSDGATFVPVKIRFQIVIIMQLVIDKASVATLHISMADGCVRSPQYTIQVRLLIALGGSDNNILCLKLIYNLLLIDGKSGQLPIES